MINYVGILLFFIMRLFDSRIRISSILVLATLSAFSVELFFGIISNSLALATDSIHTLMDAVIIFVSIIAARIAMRPADEKHTYGYGKLEPLGCLLSGIAVVILAAFFVYESVNRLQGPPPDVLPSLIGIWGGIYVVGTDVFKVYVLRKAIRGFGGATFKTDLQHSFIDISATSLTIASIPITIFGLYFMDSIASLLLGVLLAMISIRIVHKAALELLDVTSPKMVEDVKTIMESVPEVIRVGPVLLRRSGNTLFADATAIVRGDTSVDKAHDISEDIEGLVKKHVTESPVDEEHSHGLSEHIKDAKITVRVEPDWTDVPIDSQILEIAKNIDEVLDASHASTHKIGDRMYADLHVKVQKDISLASTYEISNKIEADIKASLPGIRRTTIRLEPYDELHEKSVQKDADTDALIRSILGRRPEVLGTIKILSLKFGNVYKIDIDCMLDGEKSIEQIHNVLVDIEHDILKEIKNAIITIHPVPV